MDASAEVSTVGFLSLWGFFCPSPGEKRKGGKKSAHSWCKWRVTYEYLTNGITRSPADEKKSKKDPGERIRDVCSALTFSLLTKGLQSNVIMAQAGEALWAVAADAEPPHHVGSPPAWRHASRYGLD